MSRRAVTYAERYTIAELVEKRNAIEARATMGGTSFRRFTPAVERHLSDIAWAIRHRLQTARERGEDPT